MSAPQTLMGLWSRHKHECRPVGQIVAEARAGKLPGVKEAASGFGFIVTNERSALAAMAISSIGEA